MVWGPELFLTRDFLLVRCPLQDQALEGCKFYFKISPLVLFKRCSF